MAGLAEDICRISKAHLFLCLNIFTFQTSSGYRIPHPLIHLVELKVQTSSGNVSPVEVVSAAIEDLSNESDHLQTAAQDALDKWRRENAGQM